MKCNTCTHNEVCKYKEDYQKAVKSVEDIKCICSSVIKIECSRYKCEIRVNYDWGTYWSCSNSNFQNQLNQLMQYCNKY